MLHKGTEQTGLQQQVATTVDGSGEEIIESYEVVAPDVLARDVQRSGQVWQAASEMCDALRQVHRRFITDEAAVATITTDMVQGFKSKFSVGNPEPKPANFETETPAQPTAIPATCETEFSDPGAGTEPSPASVPPGARADDPEL